MNPTLLTPSVKRLIIHKMSVDAIPAGGGVIDGVKFLATPGSMKSGLTIAAQWVAGAITAVRNAASPNPWRESSDEEIATEILNQIAKRKGTL